KTGYAIPSGHRRVAPVRAGAVRHSRRHFAFLVRGDYAHDAASLVPTESQNHKGFPTKWRPSPDKRTGSETSKTLVSESRCFVLKLCGWDRVCPFCWRRDVSPQLQNRLQRDSLVSWNRRKLLI